jgi:transposase
MRDSFGVGDAMRGEDQRSEGIFSYVRMEQRIPVDHPLRVIRDLVDAALRDVSRDFSKLYARDDRPSIPPERLVRALLLQAFFTVRSERQLMEQLDYNLLFRWFVGLSMDDPVWDATVFCKNRDRLLDGDIAANGLLVDARVTEANGTAERTTALDMIEDNARPGSTVGGDKNYDTADFVVGCRERGCTPHVSQNDTNRRSAIDARTTRHPGYRISTIKRKRIEEPFGWIKTVGGLRKTRHRGRGFVEWFFVLTAAAYNLIRIPKILLAA